MRLHPAPKITTRQVSQFRRTTKTHKSQRGLSKPVSQYFLIFRRTREDDTTITKELLYLPVRRSRSPATSTTSSPPPSCTSLALTATKPTYSKSKHSKFRLLPLDYLASTAFQPTSSSPSMPCASLYYYLNRLPITTKKPIDYLLK